MTCKLRLENISAGYRRRPVLAGITTAFAPGTLNAVLGPNGAGKTTLLRVLSGMLKPTSGSLTLNGTDLTRLSPRDYAKHVALVPQVSSEPVPLTVRESVVLARYPHLTNRFRANGGDNEAVSGAIADLGLEHLADVQVNTLSGGELRRVMIAQGLAQQAGVLLLDEPTAFLDPPARWLIINRVAEVARERGLTVVAVLHDPELALRFANFAVLVNNGMVLAQGEACSILTRQMMEELYESTADWFTSSKEK